MAIQNANNNAVNAVTSAGLRRGGSGYQGLFGSSSTLNLDSLRPSNQTALLESQRLKNTERSLAK